MEMLTIVGAAVLRGYIQGEVRDDQCSCVGWSYYCLCYRNH